MTIHFIHSTPTPHNTYLLDAVASMPGVTLERHYLQRPTEVPGRPWAAMGVGDVQADRVHVGYHPWWDWRLLRLAWADRTSVFFVIGWDYPVLVLVLLILGLRRRPLIMWDDGPSPEALRDFTRWWRPRPLMKRVLIALINRTDGAYFYTGALARAGIVTLGVRERKLVPLPFFVRPGDAVAFRREDYGAAPSDVLLVAGGRLIPEKGYLDLVEALATLHERRTAEWYLVLFGSGPERPAIEQAIERAAIGGRVRLVPWAEPEAFANAVCAADVFVAPARFDHFPTTVIGAMQAGVPVVATDGVGSAAEFVRHGENGMLVPAGDPAALAAALEVMVGDAPGRARMGVAAASTLAAWPVLRGAELIVDEARRAREASWG